MELPMSFVESYLVSPTINTTKCVKDTANRAETHIPTWNFFEGYCYLRSDSEDETAVPEHMSSTTNNEEYLAITELFFWAYRSTTIFSYWFFPRRSLWIRNTTNWDGMGDEVPEDLPPPKPPPKCNPEIIFTSTLPVLQELRTNPYAWFMGCHILILWLKLLQNIDHNCYYATQGKVLLRSVIKCNNSSTLLFPDTTHDRIENVCALSHSHNLLLCTLNGLRTVDVINVINNKNGTKKLTFKRNHGAIKKLSVG